MIQMYYYKQQKSNKSSHNCSLTLLQWIIKIARGQWDHCNEVPHQSNTQLVLDLSANIKINTQYDLGPIDLPKVSQIMLQVPRTTTLNLNHWEKLQWIVSLKAERSCQKRSWIHGLQANNSSFGPGSPQKNTQDQPHLPTQTPWIFNLVKSSGIPGSPVVPNPMCKLENLGQL